MTDSTLADLQEIVGRLESVADTLQKGRALTTNQRAVLDDALDSQFVQGMKRLVKPGFSPKLNGE
jgi:hypothetical protein